MKFLLLTFLFIMGMYFFKNVANPASVFMFDFVKNLMDKSEPISREKAREMFPANSLAAENYNKLLVSFSPKDADVIGIVGSEADVSGDKGVKNLFLVDTRHMLFWHRILVVCLPTHIF
ncbi:MAG: hypothetical protein RLZZ210_306 [Pseudomonadota bacterium]